MDFARDLHVQAPSVRKPARVWKATADCNLVESWERCRRDLDTTIYAANSRASTTKNRATDGLGPIEFPQYLEMMYSSRVNEQPLLCQVSVALLRELSVHLLKRVVDTKIFVALLVA